MEGDLQRRFGANVRAVREAQGVSQEAFAQVLGRHRTYVGGIERGERNLTLKTVERLAALLRADPLILLGCGGGGTAAPAGNGNGTPPKRRPSR